MGSDVLSAESTPLYNIIQGATYTLTQALAITASYCLWLDLTESNSISTVLVNSQLYVFSPRDQPDGVQNVFILKWQLNALPLLPLPPSPSFLLLGS